MGNIGLLFGLVLGIPLIGAILVKISKPSFASIISVSSIGISFLLSIILLLNSDNWESQFTWLPNISLGWRLDSMSRLLITLLLFISLLVHLFSVKYMDRDQHRRYFSELGLFTFSMVGLLAANHLILFFIFWELVGFSSYLLIGFWHEKADAATSAKWAFMTNRVADVALLAGILMLGAEYSFFMSEMSEEVSVWVGFGLLIGAMGKSGQFPFSAWLPRAMTGPTPVSALIHAATMVAAGVYLMIRMAPFLPETVLIATVIVGCSTAFIGAFSALTQHDIKKVLAYSTVSQLGFMFLSIGVQAEGSAFFHLWTHAFFKAGLFLAAGAIIYQIGTQDMRKMGGILRHNPMLFGIFLACGFALAGIPFFSGFMSKEGILQAVWQWSGDWVLAGYSEVMLIPIFTFFTVFLTAWYLGRLVWLVFFGKPEIMREDGEFKLSFFMALPLLILAIFSVWITQSIIPFSDTGYASEMAGFEEPINHQSGVIYWSVGLAIIGLLVSYFYYNPKANYALNYQYKNAPKTVVGNLSISAFYLDAFYEKILAVSYLKIAHLARWIDLKIVNRLIDGIGVFGVVISKFIGLIDRVFVDGIIRFIGGILLMVGDTTRRTQSRFVQYQLLWLLLGVILILYYILYC